MADSLDLMRARRVAMSEAAICERNKAMEQILRWCDRGGEEPEGQCLHEIEQICRKQLGLKVLVVSRDLTLAEHTEERIANCHDDSNYFEGDAEDA